MGYWVFMSVLSSPLIIPMTLAFRSFEYGLVIVGKEYWEDLLFVKRGPCAKQVPAFLLLNPESIARSTGELFSRNHHSPGDTHWIQERKL